MKPLNLNLLFREADRRIAPEDRQAMKKILLLAALAYNLDADAMMRADPDELLTRAAREARRLGLEIGRRPFDALVAGVGGR